MHNHNKRRGGPGWDGVREKLCVSPLPGHGAGRETTDPGDGFPLSGGILLPSPLFPRSPRNSGGKKKKNKSPPHAPGLPGRVRHPERPPASLRAPSPSLPGKEPRPGPAPPLLPRPREGKHKGAGTGAGRGGGGGVAHAPHAAPGSPTIVPSQVPRWRLQLGFARRSHDVIRKSNEIMFSNSKN